MMTFEICERLERQAILMGALATPHRLLKGGITVETRVSMTFSSAGPLFALRYLTLGCDYLLLIQNVPAINAKKEEEIEHVAFILAATRHRSYH
jgi:hypothetical protein